MIGGFPVPKVIPPVAANVRLSENQPEFEAISVRRDIIPYDFMDGGPPRYVPMWTACIEFTPEELAQIREQHGKFYISIMSNNFPPIRVMTEDENLVLLLGDKSGDDVA